MEWRNPENAVDALPEPATGAAVAGGEAQPEALAAVSQADCRDGHARGGACDAAFNAAMRRAGKACSLTRWNVAIAAVDMARDPDTGKLQSDQVVHACRATLGGQPPHFLFGALSAHDTDQVAVEADSPSNFCRTLFQIERAALHSYRPDAHSC